MGVPRLAAVLSGDSLRKPFAGVIFLGSALGSDHRIWNGMLSGFESRYAVVRFDLPGHGVTPTAHDGFTMDELADAVIELADRLGVERFFYSGVSIGGALGLVLARRFPDRVMAAAIICSAATFGGAASGFAERAASVRAEGMGFVTPNIPARWFAPSFIQAQPEVVADIVDVVGSCDPEGYAQCCDALVSYDESDHLGEIATPILVVSGELDPGTTPEVGKVVAAGVQHGLQKVIAGTSHMAIVEEPGEIFPILLVEGFMPHHQVADDDRVALD